MGAIDELKTVPAKIKPDEVKLARQVIGNFETEGDLTQYQDDYQNELRKIDRREDRRRGDRRAGRGGAAEGRQPHGRAAAEPRARVGDQEEARPRLREAPSRLGRLRKLARETGPRVTAAVPPALASAGWRPHEKAHYGGPDQTAWDRPIFRSFTCPAGAAKGVYAPRLYGARPIQFADRRRKIDETRRVAFLVPLDAGTRTIDWDAAPPTDARRPTNF